jgi:two-component system, sensor histidine kinase
MTRSSTAGGHGEWWWIFDPRCSLRARAGLVFGGAAVMFTLLTAWLGGAIHRRHLQMQLGFMFETLAVQVSDKIDRVISERYRELEFVSGLAPFRDGGNAAERRRVLVNLQGASPDYAWIGFVDPAGRVIAATQGQLEGSRMDQQRWFRGAHERPFIAGPVPLGASGAGAEATNGDSRVIELAIPVTGSNLEFAGVLGAQLRWDWARDVQLSVVPETARWELLGVTIYASPTDVLLDSGGTGWTAPPGAPDLPMARRFRGAMLEHAEGGTTYLTGYMRSRGLGEHQALGWLTVVRQPIDHALAPAREFQLAIARWGMVLSLLIFVLSWMYAGGLSRRIRTINAAAERIRSGDILTTMPLPHGQSELDRMCGAVSDLVEDLREKAHPPAAGAMPPTPPAAPGRERPSSSDPRRVMW